MSIEFRSQESFRDWNPNIQSLADRLLIGPQRELLEKVQRLNQRFGLGLNITRTYRWSPGYMDKIKDWMMNKYIEIHMKRKISTFFNQMWQKSWAFDELKRQLNQIDDKMAEKRRMRAVFQDNSDLIEDRWAIFHRILVHNQDKVRESLPNITLSMEVVKEFDTDKEYISFTWYLPQGDMNLFIGHNSYPIKMGKVEVNLLIEIDTLIMSLCNDTTNFGTGDDGTEFVRFADVNGSTYTRFKGWYESPFESNNRDFKLTHPFVSAWSHAERIIDEVDFTNICLGDLQGRIWSEFLSLDLIGMTLTLMQWNTTYNARDTRPLNNIKHSFYGISDGCDTEEFRGLYNVLPRDCNYRDYEESPVDQSIAYCDWSNCSLRNRCDHYLEHMGEPLVEGTSSEVTTEDPMSVPLTDQQYGADLIERSDNIHGGEDLPLPDELAEYRRIAEENGLTDEETIAMNEAEEDLIAASESGNITEETVIAWAAQNGGNLINIRREER